MNVDVARERETRPGSWVEAVLAATNLDEEAVAVRVKKRASTIYRWQNKGIEFLDFVGLLVAAGLFDEESDRLVKRLTGAGLPQSQALQLVKERDELHRVLVRPA